MTKEKAILTENSHQDSHLDYSATDQKVISSAKLTVINSTNPERLTKHYSLQQGQLHRAPGGKMYTGRAQVVDVSGLQGLADLLSTLQPNQALCYGTPERAEVDLVSRDAWLKMGKPDSPIARIKQMFFWPSSHAVMMFDYDPRGAGKPLSKDELLQALHSAMPSLAGVSCVWLPSSSSHITNGDTDEDLTGLKGQRLYFIVRDGRDIERAGKDLQTYLWAAGLGYIMISSNGSKLTRTVFDATVWQSNRLDFAAGASCQPPLIQRRGTPEIIAADVEVLDTLALIPPPPESVRKAADVNIAQAKLEASHEAEIIRNGFIEMMAHRIAGDEAADDEQTAKARRLVERALSHKTLAGDFLVTVVMPDGSKQEITVGHILDNRETFHGLTTLDPIEPDYDGGRPVGKLYLMSATPGINSFAHGGQFFKLTRPPEMIELVRGKTVDGVEHVLNLARNSPEAFDFGGPLVIVERGQVHPMDKHSLMHWLGGMTQFWRWQMTKNGQAVMVLEDPPVKIADQLLALGNRRKLKQLEAVITAPTIRPDGSLLNRPGFDALTGLLLDVNEDDLYPIPLSPTVEDVEQALARLMRPFADFPLVGRLDRSVLLASVLTAAVRPSIPTAPGFGFDAPVQGSGKTLLAKSLAALAGGQKPKIHPHCKEEEEIRKRLMTILLGSPRAVVWDNIIGVFDSASLAGLLTSSSYSDRILGVSKDATLPNRALWLLTGNNLTLAGDMPRRVLKCRIDPESDRPFARQFDLDPEIYCLSNRQRMIADALTIIRGWFAAGCPRAEGQMASFEQWDTLVRQPVAWIASYVEPFDYEDVMDAVDEAQASDPEQELWGEVLDNWWLLFQDKSKTAKEVLEGMRDDSFSRDTPQAKLRDALDEYLAGRHLTARSLGKILQFRTDRVVDGKRLRRIKTSGKHAQQWRVEQIK